MAFQKHFPPVPQRRFFSQPKTKIPLVLPPDHPAIVGRKTYFPTRVFQNENPVLKSGRHSRKLGSHVTRGGEWAGMPIFSLTLEERATCPSTCSHWHDCYGNHMHHSRRHVPGAAFEARLGAELAELQQTYPKGFVVRLHVLGDFYSSEYVLRWGDWLKAFSALRVFGFTARNPFEVEDGIGLALLALWHTYPERWWIRFSDRDSQTWMATGETGITCPAQTGATACCGTCGLCWRAKKPIRFIPH